MTMIMARSLIPTALRSSIISTTTVSVGSVRTFACAPAEKIRCVFEEYRRQNYSDELPSRFKKTLFKDIVSQSDNTIEIDSINRLLVNIGRSDQILSKDELDMILTECGEKPESSRCLSAAAIVALV